MSDHLQNESSHFSHIPLASYLDQLASDAPTPGGGAAAAISAAQGVALFGMVGRLSLKKSDKWASFLPSIDNLRKEFLEFAREDASAFKKVMTALALPKSDSSRPENLAESLRGAARPPLGVIELSWDAILEFEPLISYANPQVISDGGIAISLLCSAIESSAYNVRINLKYLKDEGFKEQCGKRLEPIEQLLEDKKRSILEQIDQLI